MRAIVLNDIDFAPPRAEHNVTVETLERYRPNIDILRARDQIPEVRQPGLQQIIGRRRLRSEGLGSRFACLISGPAANLGVLLRTLCTKPLQLGQDQSGRPFLAFRAMNVRIVQTCGEPLGVLDAPLQKGFKPVAKQILVTSRWSETHIAFSHPDVSQFITRSTGKSRQVPTAPPAAEYSSPSRLS